MPSMSRVKLPIACDLNSLTGTERRRRQLVFKKVAQTIIGRSELANGFELTFDSAGLDLSALGEWIALERRCCRFLRFRLDLEPTGKTTLALTGGRRVKEFLQTEALSLFHSRS